MFNPGMELPRQLSAAEEEQLLKQLASGSSAARDALIEHNLRLVFFVVRRYEHTEYEREELVSVGVFGVIKAVDSYDSSRNAKLGTYITTCVGNEIKMFLRKNKRHQNVVSLDVPVRPGKPEDSARLSDVLCAEGESVYDTVEYQLHVELLRGILSNLPVKEREVVYWRYGLGNKNTRPQSWLARRWDLNQSSVSRLEQRVLYKLREGMKEH